MGNARFSVVLTEKSVYLVPMTEIGNANWEELIRVWLRDPMDKALDIRGHASRAQNCFSAAFGQDGDNGRTAELDPAAANRMEELLESLPVPSIEPDGESAFDPAKGRLKTFHALDGRERETARPEFDEADLVREIKEIVEGLEDSKARFLALWRMLPERIGHPLNALPAIAGVPDHSLTDRADIATGIWAGVERDDYGAAFLSFALGPVQPFIEAARTLRDLWAGSAILSSMAFAAMRPILDHLGPTAFVYPALRGNPLMDMWLRDEANIPCVRSPSVRAGRSPSLPHRFLAIVPWGCGGETARDLAEQCRKTAREEWLELSEGARETLADKTDGEFSGWDRLWQAQAEAFFHFHATAVPTRELTDEAMAAWLGGNGFDDIWPDAAIIRRLYDTIPASERSSNDRSSVGRWQAMLEVSARIMEAERMIRPVPTLPEPADDGRVAPKCALLGTFEQMGPADFSEAKKFWNATRMNWQISGSRLRKRERLSAVALTKRFAMPILLEKMGLDSLRFPDTATIAARAWLRESEIDWERRGEWSGRWLHDSDALLKKDGEDPAPSGIREMLKDARSSNGAPPAYYAVLMMDGDDLGGWLRGEWGPKIGDIMHPDLRAWFERRDAPQVAGALDARRPVGPALHAAISGALARFASRIAPGIIQEHEGEAIYSGGDDLLALLPVRGAVACARDLRAAYRNGDETSPGMGSKATVSAGLAFVHWKEDFRLSLAAARGAEKRAKAGGKDALAIRFMRRSGEHSEALLDWDGSEWFDDLAGLFDRKANNRWAYRLRAELPTLSGPDMPEEMIEAEIRRLGDRADDRGERKTGEEVRISGAMLAGWWRTYRDARRRRDEEKGTEPSPVAGNRLSDFVALCQGADFVARRRDD